jgi:hypothetical protein
MPIEGIPSELAVAAYLAQHDWHIYYPRRDVGFDFIVSKLVGGGMLLRPVQVRSRRPRGQSDRKYFGHQRTKLSQTHPEMVLAMPFYDSGHVLRPLFIGFFPWSQIHANRDGERYHCLPAKVSGGRISIRRDFRKFFDDAGCTLMEREDFREQQIDNYRA